MMTFVILIFANQSEFEHIETDLNQIECIFGQTVYRLITTIFSQMIKMGAFPAYHSTV